MGKGLEEGGPPPSSLRQSCHIWCSELRRVGLLSCRDQDEQGLRAWEEPHCWHCSLGGWKGTGLKYRWKCSGLTLPPTYLARPQGLCRAAVICSDPPVSQHPLGNLVTDESTSPVDRRFQKAQSTPVSSPGIVSPDPGTRKELDIRPLDCACAGCLGTPTWSHVGWAECPGAAASHFLCRVPGPPGLVLLGPLHSEKRVHNRWLPLRVAEVLLLAVLLCPGPSPGWGPQTAGPGQWVQACW